MSTVVSERLGEPERAAGNAARGGDLSRGGRVLLIEDEAGIADFVRRGLEGEGLLVQAAADGVEGERLAREGGFDAVVLDLLLPGRPGLEILRRSARSHPSTLKGADIELDLITRKVRRGGRTIPLSPTEFELLSYLVHHRGQAVSREQVLGAVWRYEHNPATNVVDGYIGYRLGETSGEVSRLSGRLARVGLRWRLAAGVVAVTVLCTGITFVAVYRGTGTQLRRQIESEIAEDAGEPGH